MSLLLLLSCAYSSGYDDGCRDAEATAYLFGALDCSEGRDFDARREPNSVDTNYSEGLEDGWADCYGDAYSDGWTSEACRLP